MKLKTFIDSLPIASALYPMYECSVKNPTSNEVVEFLSLCSVLIDVAPHQLLDWEIADFIKELHDLEDDLINYQYLSDMESVLLMGVGSRTCIVH